VTCQLAAVNGVARARERLRDEPQLHRRSAQTMDQQNADTATWPELALVFDA
jgi:hypothetical protein